MDTNCTENVTKANGTLQQGVMLLQLKGNLCCLNCGTGAMEGSAWRQHLQIAEICILCVIFFRAAPGNVLVILVQLKNKTKSSTDYFVMTMAAFEFICSTVNVFLQIIKIPLTTRLTTAFCRLYIYTSYTTSTSSALLLATIAIDRYLKTCRSLVQACKADAAKKICIAIAFASVIFPTPSLLTLDRNT